MISAFDGGNTQGPTIARPIAIITKEPASQSPVMKTPRTHFLLAQHHRQYPETMSAVTGSESSRYGKKTHQSSSTKDTKPILMADFFICPRDKNGKAETKMIVSA
jgi:hypothetical protein